MTTTDQLSQQLKALPPDLPDEADRLDQIGQRVVRRRRRTAAVTAAGAFAVVLAGWGVTQVIPGDPGPTGPAGSVVTTSPGFEFSNRSPGTVLGSTALAEPTTFTGSGVQEVDLAGISRPEGTEALRLRVDCEGDALAMWPFRAATVSCRPVDGLPEQAYQEFPRSFLVPVEQADGAFTIQVTDEASWELVVEPVEVDQIPFGVNERGQTYGVASPMGEPDLVEVRGEDMVGGYVEASRLEKLAGATPETLEELERWREVEREPLEIPTYSSDGVTVKGRLEIQVPVERR
ncbi:hypothetical protein BJF86_14900 [Serinicoccus sp. CNJ-927]|uniref:hypothetical protein n=1 Tax=Serinicoccus sp. CNJ-927 TaxID=1904970 RepID=UPI000960600E|nr:hypothetical protein [Serinicoccus sp. CNJ-927]OLT42558.1 hypothetical protein BJF86_14900 [Serinicoccus sp. CNJ-927]